jgi:hypothetical protein
MEYDAVLFGNICQWSSAEALCLHHHGSLPLFYPPNSKTLITTENFNLNEISYTLLSFIYVLNQY